MVYNANMAVAETTPKLFNRAKVRAERDRKLNGLEIDDFAWLHLACGKSVVEEQVGGGIRKRCNTHNVTSAVLPTPAQ